MKKAMKLFFVLVSFLWVAPSVFADELTADSKIAQVTVFTDSALVSRQARVQLSAGTHTVVFSNIIPEVDENSLRVSGEGSALVKILGAQVKKEFLKEASSEKVKQLEKDIENLENEKRKVVDANEVVMQERGFLGSLTEFSQKQLPEDLVTKVPSTKELSDLLAFLDSSLKSNFAQAFDFELKIKEIDKKIDVLRRELAGMALPNKLKRSIIVEVEALKAGSLDLSISYLVRGASWMPVYDARASFDKSEVELILYGIVQQVTGEDWSDVEITLSTAKPNIYGKMPEIMPWFLRVYQPVVEKMDYSRKGGVMQLASFSRNMKSKESADDLGEQFGAIGSVEEEKIVAEMSYATSQEKGISVIYKVARKATLKSDGSQEKLPIATQTLSAQFKYLAYPRAFLSSYLASSVTNAKDQQLLPGRVNVFLDQEFVGTSGLDNIGPGEKFDLFLGIDENVKVKKELVEKKMDDVLIANIPSPNRKIVYKYKLIAENYKNKKIDFELFEAMPISQDERIKVKIDSVSLEPKEKDWKDKKGVWRWVMELEPKVKKEIFYTMTVEYPRNLQVEGL